MIPRALAGTLWGTRFSEESAYVDLLLIVFNQTVQIDGCWTKKAVKQHMTAIKRLIIIVQYAQVFSYHWPDCG